MVVREQGIATTKERKKNRSVFKRVCERERERERFEYSWISRSAPRDPLFGVLEGQCRLRFFKNRLRVSVSSEMNHVLQN